MENNKPTAFMLEQGKALMSKYLKINKLEVKTLDKSVKSMWQRVDKHICPESQLFETVWKELESKFIKRWSKWEQYANKLYPEPLQPTSEALGSALHLYADKPSPTKKPVK